MMNKATGKIQIKSADYADPPAKDAKTGTLGKVFVFQYNREWQGEVFKEKEISVYFKLIHENIMLLTVKARYGKDFSREGETNEIGI